MGTEDQGTEHMVRRKARPRLLDLYCGAGGAARGYHDAGFEVIGVDINFQPNYPYKFIKMDALEILEILGTSAYQHWSEFNNIQVIHASPPCQRYSRMTQCHPGLSETYPDIVEDTRELLVQTGLPYVIENVETAPLKDPITLCAWAFGFRLYRHRLFESNMPISAPHHYPHTVPASPAGKWKEGTIMSVAGHIAPMSLARQIMAIDWMTRDELVEAIPPYYTLHVGEQIMEALQ